MESFWSTLKLELLYRRTFASHHQAQSEIFDYIEAFYNRQRLHSALNYRSPVAFELQTNETNPPFSLSVFSPISSSWPSPDGKSYTVTIPGKGHTKTFRTRTTPAGE